MIVILLGGGTKRRQARDITDAQFSHVSQVSPPRTGTVACRGRPGVPGDCPHRPRRSGKTFLRRHAFPSVSYALLEDPDVVARLRADPQGFLDGIDGPCILDEV